MNINTLSVENTLLLVVDIQEKISNAMLESEKLIKNAEVLVKSANILNIPIICTEQYPKGLGKTVEPLLSSITQSQILEKTEFSCCKNPAINNYLSSFKRNQIIVCGIEAHVCINQTVHDLLALGYQPHIILDAISSRKNLDLQTAIKKMENSKAILSSTEIALFELLKTSTNSNFKNIQKLIL